MPPGAALQRPYRGVSGVPGPVTYTPVIALGLETTTRGGWYAVGPAPGAPGKRDLWSYTLKNTADDLATARTTLRALLQSLATPDRNFRPGIPAAGARLPVNDRMFGDVADHGVRVAAFGVQVTVGVSGPGD